MLEELVSALPSDTVSVPRVLPPYLVQRLDGIAGLHGGRVPLHSRLFAEWLHHAYPRECPHPAKGGSSQALRPSEWRRSGRVLQVTDLDRAAEEFDRLASQPEA